MNKLISNPQKITKSFFYPLINVQITTENPNFEWENSLLAIFDRCVTNDQESIEAIVVQQPTYTVYTYTNRYLIGWVLICLDPNYGRKWDVQTGSTRGYEGFLKQGYPQKRWPITEAILW